MPIFDFHCRACGADNELLVRGAHAPVCPKCGSDALDKQVAAPATPGRSAGLVREARAQAAREGHFSNYGRGEIPRR